MSEGLLLGSAAAAAEDEWPFAVERVELGALFVDHAYQRPVQERFVKQLADEFDETLVGCLDVSDRGGEPGRYAILDGQQRFAAMGLVGKATCFAAVFDDMEIEDEAGFFYRKNRDRRTMKGYFGFRARLVAGDVAAASVDEIVRAQGFELAEGTDHVAQIGAVSALERAWTMQSDVRQEALSPALATIRRVWRGRRDSLSGDVVAGLARFWAAFADSDVQDGPFYEALDVDVSSPRNLVGLGQERRMPLAYGMAHAVAEAYNRRVPDTPLDAAAIGPKRRLA